jgi:hypothetical protein
MEQAKVRVENDFQEEIDSLTKKHQRELIQRPTVKTDSTNSQWMVEREEMSRQMSMLTEHLESSKKMQDSLIDAMKVKGE